MKKKLYLICLTAILMVVSCSKDNIINQSTNTSGSQKLKASAVGDVVGKVVVGYQGWFSCAGDGSTYNTWSHMNLECWPDVREYTTTYSGCPFFQVGVQQAGFTGNLGNGTPAKMFSSWTAQTVAKHMEWMQTYGIDCAAVQRFGSYTVAGTKKDFFDKVLARVRNSAEVYGRKFFVMYDCSATDAIPADYTGTTKSFTASTAYAKQNGKPVICLWGVGASGRGTIANWVTMINWLKAQGCYVIGGVIQGWRGGSDMSAYKACDMIMPWMVGKTGDQTYFETWYRDDLAWCNANGKDYQADIYPGTSFYNSDPTWPKNKLPRMHGDFMWKQFAAARNTGVKNVYISMFDECQEATQIFKTAENSSMVPAGKYFLNLDADGVACSSDFYLRLTNDGVKMIKGQIGYTTTHPTAHK